MMIWSRMAPAQRLKWLKGMSAASLLVATAGLTEHFLHPGRPLIGALIMISAINLAAILHAFGPMRPKQRTEYIDERQELWRARSNLFAYRVLLLVAFIGITGLGLYALGASLRGWPVRSPPPALETFGDWLLALGAYLTALFLLLPTLHASWMMPDIIDDGDES